MHTDVQEHQQHTRTTRANITMIHKLEKVTSFDPHVELVATTDHQVSPPRRENEVSVGGPHPQPSAALKAGLSQWHAGREPPRGAQAAGRQPCQLFWVRSWGDPQLPWVSLQFRELTAPPKDPACFPTLQAKKGSIERHCPFVEGGLLWF